MRPMGMKTSVLSLVLLLGLVVVPRAGAFFAGGGKDVQKGNDCLIGYTGIDDSDVTLDGNKNVVQCTDCDPSCDHDGDTTANGSCTFEVGVCIDQPGVANCTPAAGLDKAKASAKVKGVKGGVDIQLPQLLEGSACGALLELDVPVKETKKGAKNGSGTVKLSAQVKKNKDAGIDKTRKDKDKLTYVCVPRPEGESCPSGSTTSTTTVTTTTSTTTTTNPCGNHQIDAGEECDDGNANDGDGCTRFCTLCGNGTVTPPETCETPLTCSGGANDGLTCTTTADCPGGFCSTKNVEGCDANCTVPACGNGNVSGNETCDDGNTDDQDNCPSDCIIDTCTNPAGDYTVSVNFAGSENVAGITVFLDYPEGQVIIPGSGAETAVQDSITDLPGFAFGQANDLDHALIEAIADTAAFPSGLLFKVHFQSCDGATPAANTFACTVTAAGAADLTPISGVTCSISVP